MRLDHFGHELAFVLRFDDHFTGEPVGDELSVRLGGTLTEPVQTPAGGYRHGDGTYRFVDVDTGSHELLWAPPLERQTESWVSWQTPLSVTVPRAQPSQVIVRELWPTPAAPVAASVTAIRGKLIGANSGDRRVAIEPSAAPPAHRFTRTDSSGEFLFVVAGPAPISGGRIALTAAVDGATVSGGHVAGAPFAGANFEVIPSRATRVTFAIT